MTETQLKLKVMKMIRKEFPHVWFFKVHDMSRSGLPDLIFCVNGQFGAIELKVEGNGPTKLQLHELGQIHKSGGVARVCYSVDEVRREIILLDNKSLGGKIYS